MHAQINARKPGQQGKGNTAYPSGAAVARAAAKQYQHDGNGGGKRTVAAGEGKLLSSIRRGQSSGRSRANHTFTISMFKVGTNAANTQNSASRSYRQNTGRRQPRRSAARQSRFAQIVQHSGNRVKPCARVGMDGVHQRRLKSKAAILRQPKCR